MDSEGLTVKTTKLKFRTFCPPSNYLNPQHAKESPSTPPPPVPQTQCARETRDHKVSWTQVSTSSTFTAPFPPPLIRTSSPLHVLQVSQLTCFRIACLLCWCLGLWQVEIRNHHPHLGCGESHLLFFCHPGRRVQEERKIT